ncbi:MAG TPA: HXXEE domain-containing protein [Solirubrobacterales bacterium]
MQRTTTVGLGLFAAWACHDLEELFTMRETSRVVAARIPDWVPIPDDVRQDGLSQQHVNLSISLVGAYLAGVCAVGVRSQGRSRLFRSALLGFGLHGFAHIGGTIALRQYTTGVATSPTIVIPYWLWARRAIAREGLSDREGTARWAAATLLLLPVVHVATRLLLNAVEAAGLRE